MQGDNLSRDFVAILLFMFRLLRIVRGERNESELPVLGISSSIPVEGFTYELGHHIMARN